MNFAPVVGASLRSGYALPARRPDNGKWQHQPAEAPLIEAETLSRQSRPPLAAQKPSPVLLYVLSPRFSCPSAMMYPTDSDSYSVRTRQLCSGLDTLATAANGPSFKLSMIGWFTVVGGRRHDGGRSDRTARPYGPCYLRHHRCQQRHDQRQQHRYASGGRGRR